MRCKAVVYVLEHGFKNRQLIRLSILKFVDELKKLKRLANFKTGLKNNNNKHIIYCF